MLFLPGETCPRHISMNIAAAPAKALTSTLQPQSAQLFHEPTGQPYAADLQLLQWWTETFVAALIQSTQRMPYGMRYLARETLHALRVSNVPLHTAIVVKRQQRNGSPKPLKQIMLRVSRNWCTIGISTPQSCKKRRRMYEELPLIFFQDSRDIRSRPEDC